MVSSCHVLTLLLCFGSVLEAQALFLKAAPRQLTKEEAGILLDALVEKMKIPENVAKIAASISKADPDKAKVEAIWSIMHDDVTKLGFRDDESAEVVKQAEEIVEDDPILSLKAEEMFTKLKMGNTLSLLSVPRQLTDTEAAKLLDTMIDKFQNPELKMRLLTALKMAKPEEAVHSLVVTLMHDDIIEHGFRDDQVDDVISQVLTNDDEIAETDPALASKVEVFKSAMGMRQ